MPDNSDIDLLREYAGSGSESAFEEIVHRYINLVYSVALRFTGNGEDAQDVTQVVFVILARKAARLPSKTILTGWLYETTRFSAMNFLTHKSRRQAREQEAYMQSTLNDAETESIWRQLAPLLEGAMSQLSERDRTLVALRFFDNKSFAETAVLAGINEWAARKSVERSMEKLRAYFSQRGVASSAAIIAGALSANSVHAAPASLAKSVSAVAVAKGATTSTSTLTLVKGTLKIMAWTKAKTAILAGAGLLLVGATMTLTVEKVAARRGEAWQRKADVSILDGMPPQTRILLPLPSRDPGMDWWGGRNGKLLGLGVSSISIIQAAYDASLGRMIFSVPAPQGKYDFISTQSNGQEIALQEAVKNRFGLTGKRELIETNVFALTLRNRNVPGLNPNSDPAGQNYSRTSNAIQCVYAPMSKLVEFLENALGTPVVDRTGLTGHFDIYVKWDGTPDGLKEAVLSQLGLELVPGREPVEFLIVEKAK